MDRANVGDRGRPYHRSFERLRATARDVSQKTTLRRSGRPVRRPPFVRTTQSRGERRTCDAHPIPIPIASSCSRSCPSGRGSSSRRTTPPRSPPRGAPCGAPPTRRRQRVKGPRSARRGRPSVRARRRGRAIACSRASERLVVFPTRARSTLPLLPVVSSPRVLLSRSVAPSLRLPPRERGESPGARCDPARYTMTWTAGRVIGSPMSQ